MIREVSVWVKAKVLPYSIEYPGFRLETLQYTCEPKDGNHLQGSGNEDRQGGSPPGLTGSKLGGALTETNFQILLPSPLHTHLLGVQIAQLPAPLTISLSGPLGAGKTCLVQGIAEGLGIKENVNSPTFTLINEYHSGSNSLYHVDLYRLMSNGAAQNNEVLTSQLDEILEQHAVIAIEWAEILQNYLPPDCLQIHLSYVKDGTARQAELAGPGAKLITEEMNKILQNASSNK
jgi:tRNA threonylcarbamoyladenosine biosynthesis protein TsaE